uniref:Glutaredoxin domain-containing protein n=1 Tax=Leptocylindrus danicus TaxID=163516 RepID=A0A7S2L780_9STRA|mmetsp:Transcript_32864/g.47560  ORF Transcript_32864/g.47560 Transcript_32864/m.47560 type:complete len:163 (+) Transcript_32864:80-568(+)
MKIPTAVTIAIASASIVGAGAFVVASGSNKPSTFVRNVSGTVGSASSTTSLSMSSTDSAAFVLAEIGSNDVVVFSKTYCPFCTSTKTLFEKLNVDAKVVELDTLDNGADIQGALLDKTGQRTVPSVFIKGEHIGGNDATQAAFQSGDLFTKLGIEAPDTSSW